MQGPKSSNMTNAPSLGLAECMERLNNQVCSLLGLQSRLQSDVCQSELRKYNFDLKKVIELMKFIFKDQQNSYYKDVELRNIEDHQCLWDWSAIKHASLQDISKVADPDCYS